MSVLRVVVSMLFIVGVGCSDSSAPPASSGDPEAGVESLVEVEQRSNGVDDDIATSDATDGVSESYVEPVPSGSPSTPEADASWLSEVEPTTPMTPSTHPSDALYAAEHLVSVELVIEPSKWSQLKAQGRTKSDLFAGNCLNDPPPDVYDWFSATVTIDGETLGNVGVRKKGAMDPLTGDKPSLKLRFDKFEDDRLLSNGLRRMTFEHMRSDPSMIRACLGYLVFRRAGLPAPRCNLAMVSVNGDELGLYANVEDVRTVFLERTFGTAAGQLYEGSRSDFRAAWRGTFEKETWEASGDWTDIDAMQDALEATDLSDFAQLPQILDIDRFVHFWALEVLIGHEQGYTHSLDNYYLYRPPDTDRFVFIPWGIEDAFTPSQNLGEGLEPVTPYVNGVIARRIYETEQGRALFQGRLATLLDELWDEQSLTAEAEALSMVAVEALPDRQGALEQARDSVVEFIQGRRHAVEVASRPDLASSSLPAADICWEPLGAIELEFEVSLGQSDGNLQVVRYDWEGQALDAQAQTASLDTEGSAEGAKMRLTLMSSLASGGLDRVEIWFATEELSVGQWPIDGRDIEGQRKVTVEGETLTLAQLGDGELSLSAVDVTTGQLSGRLVATLFGMGGYAPELPSGLDPAKATLVINELAAKGEPSDWFEVVNMSLTAIDLALYRFADDLDNDEKRVAFPEGDLLQPGGYRVFFLDSDAWPGFALGSDEELGIWSQDGELVDSVNWSEGQAGSGKSFARLPNGLGEFMTVTNPTPGGSND